MGRRLSINIFMTNAPDKYTSNRNFLVPTQAEFTIKRLPDVQFFTQKVRLPGARINAVVQPNPLVDIKHPGEMMEFNEFTVTFKVDEDMVNYMSILNWIVALGFPEDHDQYLELADMPAWSGEGVYSDATLLFLNSKGRPKVECTFTDAFPLALSDIDLDTTLTDVQHVTATAAFAYTKYSLRRLNTDAQG